MAADRARALDLSAEGGIVNGTGPCAQGSVRSCQRHRHACDTDGSVERLDNPNSIAGDPVLPGFVLDLREVW